MNGLCNYCGICCKLIPVLEADKIIVRDGFQVISEELESLIAPLTADEACNINEDYVNKVQTVFPNAVFYSCKALNEENKCSLDNMPLVCSKFPCSPLAIVPDECGHLGEVFLSYEELKRRIRKIKEDILDYETLISRGDKDSDSYKKIIGNLKRFIKKYADFGAEDW